ncbi:MAG: hypothetical protein GXY36_07760 [Chloroflexi bacterium]|nr:hypothetical protein [Chloroflexota bacterium]
MTMTVERLPGESIIRATAAEPFSPTYDIPAMFAEVTHLRLELQGDVVLIIDFRETVKDSTAFTKLVTALAEAGRGIRAGRAAGIVRPPITIFVGSGPLTSLAAQSIEQAQYGGVRGLLSNSPEEALVLAREKLAELHVE